MAQYGPEFPVKAFVSAEESNASRSGIFVEVENERVMLLRLALGFESHMAYNRHLEMILRGDIRYESIVVLRKPSDGPASCADTCAKVIKASKRAWTHESHS